MSCGVKFLISLPLELFASKASRTESVLAMTTESGPAAASKPLFEAMLNKEAVGGGSASDGHGVGSRRTFDSPLIDWNPRAYTQHVSQRLEVEVQVTYFSQNFLKFGTSLCLNIS